MTTPLNILITGATSGIGLATARHLAAAGHRVFATGRNERLLAEIHGSAPNLEALRLDVTDDASVRAAAAEALARTNGRGVDVVVNNAGYGKVAAIAEVTDDEMRGQYETNVLGPVRVVRAFMPQLAANRGRVINVTSVGGQVTFPFMGIYGSTKFALEAISDALRFEVAPFGVKVVVVEPGPVRTAFEDTATAEARHAASGSAFALLFERMPEIMGRFASASVGPEVLARVIERAATEAAPAARYTDTLRSRATILLFRFLPSALSDALYRVVYGWSGDRRWPAPVHG